VRDERSRLLDFARAAVNRCHTEADALSSFEAIGQEAIVRVGWVDEDRSVAPYHQLSGRVSGLRRWRRSGLLSRLASALTGGRLRLPDKAREAENGHKDQAGRKREYG
jgi:hypothetical protein